MLKIITTYRADQNKVGDSPNYRTYKQQHCTTKTMNSSSKSFQSQILLLIGKDKNFCRSF